MSTLLFFQMQSFYERWNTKYAEFFVTRWSQKSGRQIMVGKSHRTVQEALVAAAKADVRNKAFMHFIDCVRPQP